MRRLILIPLMASVWSHASIVETPPITTNNKCDQYYSIVHDFVGWVRQGASEEEIYARFVEELPNTPRGNIAHMVRGLLDLHLADSPQTEEEIADRIKNECIERIK